MQSAISRSLIMVMVAILAVENPRDRGSSLLWRRTTVFRYVRLRCQWEHVFIWERILARNLTLGNGLKSKSAGTTTGQVFFGASNSGHDKAMTENVSTYDNNGRLIGQVTSHTTYSPGLYRNGNLVNDRDYGNGCIRMDLSDINSNMGNNANRIDLTVQNINWTTSFLLGMAVDIAYPDFAGTQTTTVNSPSSVTVKGEFKNTASTPDTGIYDGNMTVQIDSGLTPTSATAVVNGSTTIQGAISGNTVTFSGNSVASMMNGSTISYTVQCKPKGAGSTVFKNSAGFHGYLRADGTNTGYWIDRMWKASSSAVPKYTLDVQGGTGIESVTGGGNYPYGSKVTIGATVKPGYHWKGWTGSYNTADKDYTFTMPNGNVSMRAEAEANAYTVAFHPNDGGEVTHLSSIATQYDKQITLPDGAAYYVKYTLDGKNVTDQVLSGALSLMEESDEPETEEPETGTETRKKRKTETGAEIPKNETEIPETGTEVDGVTPQEEQPDAPEIETGTETGATVEENEVPATQPEEGGRRQNSRRRKRNQRFIHRYSSGGLWKIEKTTWNHSGKWEKPLT